MRIEAWGFNGLAIIQEDKLPREAGGCGRFTSSPATSLKEMLQLKEHIKHAGEVLRLRTSSMGFCRQWEKYFHWFYSLSDGLGDVGLLLPRSVRVSYIQQQNGMHSKKIASHTLKSGKRLLQESARGRIQRQVTLWKCRGNLFQN